jgi:hypothetical protein
LNIDHIRQSLEAADRGLQRAIAQLTEMRFGVPRAESALSDAARNLTAALENLPGAGDRRRLLPAVRNIRAHLSRVQALLDSAAAFQYGWTAAAQVHAQTYTAEGSLAPSAGSGIIVEA